MECIYRITKAAGIHEGCTNPSREARSCSFALRWGDLFNKGVALTSCVSFLLYLLIGACCNDKSLHKEIA